MNRNIACKFGGTGKPGLETGKPGLETGNQILKPETNFGVIPTSDMSANSDKLVLQVFQCLFEAIK